MGRLKVLDNLVLGPRLVCLVWGPSSLPNTRLCPILGSKNLDKMGLDKMRSDLSFSYEDVLSSLLNTTPCPLLGSKKPDRSTESNCARWAGTWHITILFLLFFFFLFSILRMPILLSNTSLPGTSPCLPIFIGPRSDHSLPMSLTN